MVAFRAELTALIQLYIVGVFISVHHESGRHGPHWTRLLSAETDPRACRAMLAPRAVNTVGFVSTGTVLLIALVTKFLAGAWIAIVAMGGFS